MKNKLTVVIETIIALAILSVFVGFILIGFDVADKANEKPFVPVELGIYRL